MKKAFSIFIAAVALCAALSLVSCQKGDGGKDNPSGGGDGLAGTSWSGVVTYTFKSSGGIGGGAVSGTLTIDFQSGNKCYNGFWEETVSYTLSSNTIEMKWSENNGTMTLVKNGNTMTVTGSDNTYSYSGSLNKK